MLLRASDRGRVAAPGPVLGPLDEAGLDRVSHHVAKRGQKLVVVLDPDGVVARPEDVSFHPVPHIEGNRVAEVQRVHPDRKCAVIDVEKEVIVGAEEAEAETEPARFVHRAGELPEKDDAVAVVTEELGRPDRMAVDMEEAGPHVASRSRHGATMAAATRARQCPLRS
jgi:hypothetical protein